MPQSKQVRSVSEKSALEIKTREITEGSTRLIVPVVSSGGGPLSSKVPVFYNPIMEFNRDISVIAASVLASEGKRAFLDGLAGTGIRGVRFANEIKDGINVTINDWNPLSFQFIKRNIELNNITNAVQVGEDLNVLLSRFKYDYVDIDPFGSPAYFFDSAIRSIRHNGILGATATDTGPLCGSNPKTCLRRYGSRSVKAPYMHEEGVRILLANLSHNAARHDCGISPVLAHRTCHYFRIYARVQKGAHWADKNQKEIGYALYNQKSGETRVFFGHLSLEEASRARQDKVEFLIGPLWLGPIFDKSFLKSFDGVLSSGAPFGKRAAIEKSLSLWKEEADAPALFYDVDTIASNLRTSPPKLAAIISGLRDAGFGAWRTHFSPTAFKTDAPLEDVNGLILKLENK